MNVENEFFFFFCRNFLIFLFRKEREKKCFLSNLLLLLLFNLGEKKKTRIKKYFPIPFNLNKSSAFAFIIPCCMGFSEQFIILLLLLVLLLLLQFVFLLGIFYFRFL